MPYVIATDAHVFPLTKTQPTLAAEGTRRVETLLPSLNTKNIYIAHQKCHGIAMYDLLGTLPPEYNIE